VVVVRVGVGVVVWVGVAGGLVVAVAVRVGVGVGVAGPVAGRSAMVAAAALPPFGETVQYLLPAMPAAPVLTAASCQGKGCRLRRAPPGAAPLRHGYAPKLNVIPACLAG
jgi:hypothetical protein